MWARVSDASRQNLLCRTLAARWRQGARATNGGIAEKLTHGVPTASTSGKKGQKSMCKVETRMSTPKVALALQTHSEKEKEKNGITIIVHKYFFLFYSAFPFSPATTGCD